MTAALAPNMTSMQGVPIQSEGVNPGLFMALTRRKRNTEYSRNFAGLGGVENIDIKHSDILGGIHLRFSGQVVIALNAGTVATTAEWPYGLAKNIVLQANAQTALFNIGGTMLKGLEFIANPGLSDRGVSKSVGNVAVTQGTLSKSSETWGVGSLQTAIAAGTYPVELDFYLPVAQDKKDLAGAVFCQTEQLAINLTVQWAAQTDLFVTTGAPTITLTGTVQMVTEKYSIPSAGGLMIVPDLSMFHGVIETDTSQVSNGNNEVKLLGQGAGKSLLRVVYRVKNGAGAAAVPLAVNAANFGLQSWIYSTSDSPEQYADGQALREQNEHDYGTDVAAVWGLMAHEFERINSFRDAIDMGQTSELRINVGVQNAVGLVTPSLQYVQETMFAGAQ